MEANEAQLLDSMSEEKRAQYLRLKEAQNKTFECPICIDDVPVRETYIFDDCYHRFCRNCVCGYMKEEISQGSIISQGPNVGLKCPANRCNKILGIHEIRNVVDPPTYEHYDTLLRDLAIENMSDTVWCPTAGCGNALVREAQSVAPTRGARANKRNATGRRVGTSMIMCYKCQYSWCTECKIPWHFEVTCAEYQKWVADEKNKMVMLAAKEAQKVAKEAKEMDMYMEWVRKHTKACPKCSTIIEKNGGCNHMTCRKCRHEFCWLCLGKYSYQHFTTTNCKQFS